ncbi:MAG TPA: thioesterase family protein [Frankiaceae bacterium]|nr:thioesterase family protein [Frankiaceae bacterium]
MATLDADLFHPAPPPALYVPDGELFIPTSATRGPWSPDAQHGGPVAALLCRAAEQIESTVPLAVVRLTLELLRPVPLAPLEVRARLRRPGRRVQLVDLALIHRDVEVAVATALRLRVEPVPIEGAVPPPGEAPDGVSAPPPVTDRTPTYTDDRWPWLDTLGMDVRFVAGSLDEPGPSAAWFRLRMPVIAGEEPSPAQRAMVAADSGSGVGSALDFARYRFVNPELTVHLARQPDGEWVGVQAGTMLSEQGTGVTTTRLWDAAGVIGQASAALLVEAVPNAAG